MKGNARCNCSSTICCEVCDGWHVVQFQFAGLVYASVNSGHQCEDCGIYCMSLLLLLLSFWVHFSLLSDSFLNFGRYTQSILERFQLYVCVQNLALAVKNAEPIESLTSLWLRQLRKS